MQALACTDRRHARSPVDRFRWFIGFGRLTGYSHSPFVSLHTIFVHVFHLPPILRAQLAGGNGTYDRTDQASVALMRPANGGGISQPRTGIWSRLRKELAGGRRRSNAGWVRRSRYSINQFNSLGLRAQPPTLERERSLKGMKRAGRKAFQPCPIPARRPSQP